MMDRIIHLPYDEFRRQFLDSPNPTSRTKRRSLNIFKALENADDMSANALSDVFVSENGSNLSQCLISVQDQHREYTRAHPWFHDDLLSTRSRA